MGERIQGAPDALRGVFRTAPELQLSKKGKHPVATGTFLVGGDKPGAEELPVTFKAKIAQEAITIFPGQEVIVVGRVHFDPKRGADGRLEAANTRMTVGLVHKNLPSFM